MRLFILDEATITQVKDRSALVNQITEIPRAFRTVADEISQEAETYPDPEWARMARIVAEELTSMIGDSQDPNSLQFKLDELAGKVT